MTVKSAYDSRGAMGGDPMVSRFRALLELH